MTVYETKVSGPDAQPCADFQAGVPRAPRRPGRPEAGTRSRDGANPERTTQAGSSRPETGLHEPAGPATPRDTSRHQQGRGIRPAQCQGVERVAAAPPWCLARDHGADRVRVAERRPGPAPGWAGDAGPHAARPGGQDSDGRLSHRLLTGHAPRPLTRKRHRLPGQPILAQRLIRRIDLTLLHVRQTDPFIRFVIHLRSSCFLILLQGET